MKPNTTFSYEDTEFAGLPTSANETPHDYIKRKDALKAVEGAVSSEHVCDNINAIPAADVELVVRCGKCKFFFCVHGALGDHGECARYGVPTDERGYCWKAERKDGDAHD